MKNTLLLAVVGLLVASLNARAGDAKTGFLERVHKGADGEAKYVLFVPHDYKADKTYPVILFLHGSGETGSEGEKQVKTGLGPAIKKAEKTFGFIAVFPQSQKRTWKADSDDSQRALAILELVKKEYKSDPKRIYLTGLSMGGSGTWSLAAKHPGRWAAIVPICGRGDIDSVSLIKNVPCWCFVGDADKADLVQNNRELTKALKAASSNAIYTEYPEVGHNSWDRAYATPELYDWLLKHSLK